MTVEIDHVQKAFDIFMRLVEHGEIPAEDRERFHAFQESEVRAVLEDVMERRAGVKILATAEAIYISPSVENQTFGFTNEELRDRIGVRTNQELYLSYFSILCMLAMLYNSDDQAVRAREFVPLEELESYISDQLGRIGVADAEDAATLESDLEINLRSTAEIWLDMPSYDDRLKDLHKGKNNRISFLLRVLRFLEGERLVVVLEDSEVRPTERLEQLVTRYYFHNQRKERILHFLKRPISLLPERTESEGVGAEGSAPNGATAADSRSEVAGDADDQ